MGWLVYFVTVLILSAVVGAHLGRFRAAYTEMTGMMAGMTMGMLNGFVLGYAAAAATRSMFWGNLFGIAFGLLLGLYFGRAGGLMGVMDGGMGGVMGGSMGAMLAAMIFFPDWALLWTAVLVGTIYVAGMLGLVVLIERSAPDHAHLHRVAPLFGLGRADEPAVDEAVSPLATGEPLVNYYELFDIAVKAKVREIATAYRTFCAEADADGRALAAQALATLSDPAARAAYDRALAVASGRDPCCPPPRRSPRPQARAPEGAVAPAAVAQERAAPPPPAPPPPRLLDYYRFLDLHPRAGAVEILDAYLIKIDGADAATMARAEHAWAVLSDPPARAAYDQALAENRAARAAQAPAPHGPVRPAVAAVPAASTRATPPVPAIPRLATASPPRARAAAAQPETRDLQYSRSRRRPATANPAPAPSTSSWRWALVAIPVLVVLGASLALNAPRGANAGPAVAHVPPAGQGDSRTIDPRLLAQAAPAPVVNGIQTVDVVVNGNTFQYEPAVIKVKKGVPVRFNLSAKGEPGCGRPVLIRGLGARGQVTPGQVSTMDFTPTQTGQFEMTCTMGMFGPGTVIVTE